MRCGLRSRAGRLYMYYVSPLFLRKVALGVTAQFIVVAQARVLDRIWKDIEGAYVRINSIRVRL